ncbi:MAG: hypothetical protein K9J03_02335 [Candidatus Methylopumilus sp.]|nr:hypothetical protein [Sulfuritalea sp.]MCF8193017.1 hypothetical protein [Candidatus Methylopumilus sp.]
MANTLDLSRNEAEKILALTKECPESAFNNTGHGKQSYPLMSVGIIVNGEYKRSLTVELMCRMTARPNRTSVKFTIFKMEHGIRKRVYQLDVFIPPVCTIGSHNWPHEHIGHDREFFDKNYPANFDACIEYFSKKTNISFEVKPESPFEFSLRPNK